MVHIDGRYAASKDREALWRVELVIRVEVVSANAVRDVEVQPQVESPPSLRLPVGCRTAQAAVRHFNSYNHYNDGYNDSQ